MQVLKQALLVGILVATPVSIALAQGAATGGTGGSAAVGGTSASTLGVGAASGESSSIGVGGSAAGGTNHTTSITA